MTFVARDDVRPGPAAEALLRREAHGETLGIQLEVTVGVQAGRRAIPALDRSRFVVRPGISAAVWQHHEPLFPVGRMRPEHRVGRHFAVVNDTRGERALRWAGLVAIRGTAVDVSINKASRRYGPERHHRQFGRHWTPWQAQVPSLQVTGRLDDAHGLDACCPCIENVALHGPALYVLRFHSGFQERRGSCPQIGVRGAGPPRPRLVATTRHSAMPVSAENARVVEPVAAMDVT